jgi:thiol-disulfide isomerase/thioredoxin
MKAARMTLLALLATGAWAQSITGLWDATLDQNGVRIPFRVEFSGSGPDVKGWFFNGSQKEVSNSGNFSNGALTLNFDSYAAVLKLTLKDGALDGEYVTRGRGTPIHAVRTDDRPAVAGNVPQIDGLWVMEGVKSSKKDEKAWNLILRQKGAELEASILRIDGDTGTLTGRWQDGKFVVSHFSGARANLLTITPKSDGTLAVEQFGQRNGDVVTAVRLDEARAKHLPLPTDPTAHTGVKDPTKPFVFSFPDLNGNIVSNTDERFKGKVVLINITGSWCPNCHDEAPFLAEMYDRYHDRGLEIVALSFEEAEQLGNPTRLRAFIQEYGIHYTVLLGGETNTAKEKLTSALDWDAWPTTFFVGRDGMVKSVHAGFPSPGSGQLYQRDKDEFVATVERLLSDNQTSHK